LTDAIYAYAERKCCNILAVRRSVGEHFEERIQQEISEFFTALMSTYSEINDVLEFELKHVTSYSNAKCNYAGKEFANITYIVDIKKEKR